ncbi:MAG: lipopolysaccharide kinase [Methylotenera sp.]|nr:lipopolysaccharide kinase [Methylotenera sp.]
MTFLYQAPQHQATLAFNQLNDFESIWSMKVDWFEEPNERRGGWSGVGKLVLHTPSNNALGVFLKRQENHERRTLMHPIKGIPTFACEFGMMQHLAKHDVPSLKPVAFGQRLVNGNLQALLMTEELVGFIPLEQAVKQMFAEGRPVLREQRKLIMQVAKTVSKMHRSGVQHRSLYPKHLFVDTANMQDAVVIDLEKSRIKLLPFMRTFYDLSTLNRHSEFWSKSARLYFYKQYLGVEQLNAWQKFVLKMIAKRSSRHKTHKTAKKTYQGTK